MALTDENSGMVMPVAPMYGGGYGNGGFGGGFGGDWAWVILLILLAGNGGWGMGGFGGFGGGLGYDFPWLLNGQNAINANTNSGFDHAATQSTLGNIQTALTSGFGDIQTALCGGFAGVNATVNSGVNAITSQMYNDTIAGLQSNFALQSQLANCCCENRLGIANLGADMAREACADRAAVNDALRDVIAANTASTQRILDQLCQDKIDAKNEKIAELQQQIAMKDLAASQTAQNAFIAQGFANEVDQLYNRLNTCPVPTTPVYGRTPIFTCNNGYTGCGCGGVA